VASTPLWIELPPPTGSCKARSSASTPRSSDRDRRLPLDSRAVTVFSHSGGFVQRTMFVVTHQWFGAEAISPTRSPT
jgi:hypothetical protein